MARPINWLSTCDPFRRPRSLRKSSVKDFSLQKREAVQKPQRRKFMFRIAIIIGSTRPGRNGEAVAKWVYKIAQKRSDAEFELGEIKDFNLPIFDEPGTQKM